MINNETINKLRHMKMTGMVDALEQQENISAYQEMGFYERLGLLVDQEFSRRQHNKLDRLIRLAQFQNAVCTAISTRISEAETPSLSRR